MSLLKPLKEAAQSTVFKHTTLGAPHYPYNVERIQLATQITELERLNQVEGDIVEIETTQGMATEFLYQRIRDQKNVSLINKN